MPRRARGRHAPHDHSDRPANLGTHWRADGAPKATYGSQSEAWTVADERRQDSGVTLNVYQCDVCGGWHLGRERGER